MSEDADRFRDRAKQCRRLAADAKDDAARDELNAMGDELNAEAANIDANGAVGKRHEG